jgi:3-phosphoshikimate 1-carboxyvinyltransferase
VTALELEPAGPVVARLRAPSSKSLTNRMLVCAALADGTSLLRRPLESDDSAAMRAALGRLGADVEDTGGREEARAAGAVAWRVAGTGGRLSTPEGALDARESGTTMRFLAAVATLAPGPVVLSGRPGLLARPVGPLTEALRRLGAEIGDRDGFPPVTAAGGGLDGGEAVVDAGASSQFASAVLLAGPFASRTVTLRAEDLAAPAYVELTAEVMRRFGARVDRLGRSAWRVEAGVRYRAIDAEVEHDASAAAHLYALAAATGGSVTVTNAEAGSLQPDAGLPALLEAMGATVRRDGPALTVAGPEALRPVDADLGAMPDQVTTVAALAALARGRSRLRGVEVARGHETDRLHALATELVGLGVGVEELPDGLVIDGGGARGPATVQTRGDHRLAMAFAAVAARVAGVRIEDPACVAKTYPGFWDDLAGAGLRWRMVASAQQPS